MAQLSYPVKLKLNQKCVNLTGNRSWVKVTGNIIWIKFYRKRKLHKNLFKENWKILSHLWGLHRILYVRHYKLRLVYFKPPFWRPKSLFNWFFLKIRILCMGKYLRAVNNLGQVMKARICYMNFTSGFFSSHCNLNPLFKTHPPATHYAARHIIY